MPKYHKEEKESPSLPADKAIELFKKQIGQVDNLMRLHHNDDSEVAKWENVTKQIIIKTFGEAHDNLETYRGGIAGAFFGGQSDEDEQKDFIKSLQKKKKLLEGFIEQLEAFRSIEEVSVTAITKNLSSRKVFIVHGHSEQAKTELELILTRLKFKPIILHKQANEGLITIIEKLEKHSSDVGFAFVLLTPDDKGCQNGQENNLLPRARQNVIFEFGLLVSKLGRNRVCYLRTGNVEVPSDLDGAIYLSFNNSVNEIELKIVKELRAAGYDVKI